MARAVAAAGPQVVTVDAVPSAADLRPPGDFCRDALADADADAVDDAFCQSGAVGVCHLAANPHPSRRARLTVFDSNVESACGVMPAAGDPDARRVVAASSEMATGLLTGILPGRIPVDEAERHPPPTVYALIRYRAEVVADSLAVRYPATTFAG